MRLSGSADWGQRMTRRGTSFKRRGDWRAQQERREKKGGKADEMEREIRKEDLDREREGGREEGRGEQESAGKGVVIEKNERLRALKTVLVVLCERAMDHLVTSMYWIGDNRDLWWHLKPYWLNTGPNCHNAGRGADGEGYMGVCPYGAETRQKETLEKQTAMER